MRRGILTIDTLDVSAGQRNDEGRSGCSTTTNETRLGVRHKEANDCEGCDENNGLEISVSTMIASISSDAYNTPESTLDSSRHGLPWVWSFTGSKTDEFGSS